MVRAPNFPPKGYRPDPPDGPPTVLPPAPTPTYVQGNARPLVVTGELRESSNDDLLKRLDKIAEALTGIREELSKLRKSNTR